MGGIESIKTIILSWLATVYLRFVGATSRIIWVNRSIRDELEAEGKGFVYAFWHGRQVFLVYLHRGDDIRPMISKSADGEIIAQVCRAFGIHTVRGSTSRGASGAVLRLQDEILSGARVGITPDGPRGPLHQVQPGALYLAQVTGRPIVPVAFGAKKKWTFKGWDEFIVPKPFNRIAMIYGDPLFVGPHDSLEQKSQELQKSLNYVTNEVDIISQGGCEDPVPSSPDSEETTAKANASQANRWAYPLFNTLLILASPVIGLAVLLRWRRRVFSKESNHWAERWGHLSPETLAQIAGSQRWWWVHAVSVGEVKAIETFLRRVPEAVGAKVLLSAVTPEALAWATEHHVADVIIAAPLDLPWIVRRVFKHVRPDFFVTVESEFWPNLMREAQRSGARVALINGRISERSYRSYARIRPLLTALWETIDLFVVRQTQDAQRFASLGIPETKIHVAGNLKYDLYMERRLQRRFKDSTPVVVMGSTREGEENQLLPAMERVRRQIPDVRIIWAPRHVERISEIEKLLRDHGLTYERISQLRKFTNGTTTEAPNILWDSMGDLLDAYRQADVAVVGGSFVPKGGQNPIEPAALRLPVLFGPWMENFQGVAAHLVDSGGARQVSIEELDHQLLTLLQSPQIRHEMGDRAKRAVEAEQGATDRTLNLLKDLSHA